ncbi:MAG TPA: Gfo/Idh/MocA family oxidoreductase [Candidatus Latescibacteria bacterium]|jgi:predicted dehydrogenase|nr:Gfo/Idh/MocA family oxidoreductase [Candidatus Latescibacterota bacterium]HJP30913.1 Gfo/Idh/MocA family oxidoreductase [Candidatus Latescibacterota bacterium]
MGRVVRFGIIGAAGRGNSYVRALRANPATELTALCDLRTEQLAANATELGVDHTFVDAGELIRSGTVDAVVVGTPMQFHAPQAILALEHDVHVLSEVTAAVSMEESVDLVRAARRSAATYMMAENYTYTKTNVLVRELARLGLFGEPYYGEGAYIHELKQLNEKTTWRRHWQTGVNGCTYPTHSLGPVLQWFDAGRSRPDRVVAVCAVGTGHHYRDPRGDRYEMEDSVTMMCRLASGGMVQIRVDMLSDRPHNMVHYALQGTDGAYESTDGHEAAPKVWLRERHATPTWEPLAALEEEYLPEFWKNPPDEALQAGHGGGDYWEVQDFVRAILEEDEPPIGIDAAMDMTLPGLVSQQSLSQGSTWVAVPDPRNWT